MTRSEQPIDRFTGWLVAWTALLFVATFGNVAVLYRSDEKIGKQADIASRQLDVMEAQQRPWIKIEKIEPVLFDIPVGRGVVFLKPALAIPLRINLKNIGLSPAFNIRLGVWPLLAEAEKSVNLAELQRDSCEKIRTSLLAKPAKIDARMDNYTRVLFPNDTLDHYDDTFVFALDDLKSSAAGLDLQKDRFRLWFYGCVVYSAYTSRELHQTGFAYHLGIVDAAGKNWSFVGGDLTLKEWRSVPTNKLTIDPVETAAGETN